MDETVFAVVVVVMYISAFLVQSATISFFDDSAELHFNDLATGRLMAIRGQ
jgi:hypothetical protein